MLEQKIDRLIINVASSITSAGNTALEVLERSPGVIVDHQNNIISMNGKNGVVLMINGKISHMPISAVVQMLAGMSSDNIEKIELITTPPSNLDAEGNAGYINIVLKENDSYGTNGSYSATLGYGKGLVTAANININHRKGKVNVYGDLSYSRVKGPFHGNAYAKISNSGNITENFFTAHRTDTVSNINARLGLDWQLNKKTVFGMLLNGYDNKYRQGEHNLNTLAANGKTDTIIYLNNTEKNHWYNYAGNINLQHNFNENDKLLLNLDYIHYNNNQPVNYHSGYNNGKDEFLYDDFFKSGKKTPINFLVAAADYSKKLNKNISMEAGLKQTISAFNNNISFERLHGNVWVRDNNLSAIYKLKEDYSAAYTSFNITINKSTEAKAGLRYERTNSNLGTTDTKNIVDRHYGNFFPSVFVSHTLNENSSLNFSYSRRITRPTFNDLAPFTYYASANMLLTGNPALQSSVSDNFTAGFTLKKYFLSVSYSKDNNAIAGFQFHSDSTTGKLVLSAENLINQKTASLVISAPFTVTKWWSMQYNITGTWQQVNALYKGSKLSVDVTNFNINASQNFTLPKNFSVEVSGFYNSPSLFGLTRIKSQGSLDAGIKKKLPGKWGAITLNGTNILNTNYFSGGIDLPKQNLVTTARFYFSRPTFKLTYTRNFGKEKLRAKRERTTGAEDEKGRVQ